MRKPLYELRPGSGLANWLEFQGYTHATVLLSAGQRCYEVRRVAPELSKGRLTLTRHTMRKPSTQIVELIDARTGIDGTATLTPEDVATIKKLTASLDRRDQQYRLGKKPKPAAKSAKKKGAKKAR